MEKDLLISSFQMYISQPSHLKKVAFLVQHSNSWGKNSEWRDGSTWSRKVASTFRVALWANAADWGTVLVFSSAFLREVGLEFCREPALWEEGRIQLKDRQPQTDQTLK